ncbi:hypothetical protein KR054_005733 [Drosophila jambulina]|nr:hypothetical protein KR054_005733 [Drosophila jambulina]
MAAIRILLISQLLACLLVSASACLTPVSVSSCVPFVGLNQCVNRNIKEPKLPPRDNACCGPHCSYKAITATPVCCNATVTGLCILDTHCRGGVAFYFTKMSDCTLRSKNAKRQKDGYARLISFNWTRKTCEAQNTKCGINCCCRETCPTQFCKVQTVTKMV